MHVVIVGGGPAGLYTALLLTELGIKDLIVVDPRVGNYTRVGHVVPAVFQLAKDTLNIKFNLVENKYYHIKDFEKLLYTHALEIGIKIEKKSFVGFQAKNNIPGVSLSSSEGTEWLAADYVLDCSGSRRATVHAINASYTPPLFQEKIFNNEVISNYGIAYIKMKRSVVGEITNYFIEQGKELGLHTELSHYEYARRLVNLHKHGWEEFLVPFCYGASFDKEKACLYYPMPANLKEESYTEWLEDVLKCYIPNPEAHYAYLPASKKTPLSPPLISSFRFIPRELDKLFLQQKGLPTIIPLGDAQIDSHFMSGQGILNGMLRILLLSHALSIVKGKISAFDTRSYHEHMADVLSKQKKLVQKNTEIMLDNCRSSLKLAKERLIKASLRATVEEKADFESLLEKIEHRLTYEKIMEDFTAYYDENLQIRAPQTMTASALINFQNQLIGILEKLPTHSFQGERLKVLLLNLALSWKERGNSSYKENNYFTALSNYIKAMEIYKLAAFNERISTDKLAIFSNLTLTYLQLEQYEEAVTIGKQALATYEKYQAIPEAKPLFVKIMHNVIGSLVKKIYYLLAIPGYEEEDIKVFHSTLNQLMTDYKIFINDNKNLILKKVEKLEQDLKNNTITPLNKFGLFKAEKLSAGESYKVVPEAKVTHAFEQRFF